MTDNFKVAGSVVVAAFIGAFTSRWIDKALSYPFPIDIVMLLVSGIVLFFIANKIAGNVLNPK